MARRTMYMTKESKPPAVSGDPPAPASAQDHIRNMFASILGRLGVFDSNAASNPATVAMLAHAISQAWLIDDHGLDLDSPTAFAEFAGDMRLRALLLLDGHYGPSRSRGQLQRDLQQAATSLAGNIFLNSDDRFAHLTSAVSLYLEEPDENHFNEVLATVVDSMNRARSAAPALPSELTAHERSAVQLSAAWAAQLQAPSADPHPEDDALIFLATASAAAAVLSGVSPTVHPTRIAHLWAAMVRELRAFPTETAAFLADLAPSDRAVARWAMIYGDLLNQLPELVQIAQHFNGSPSALVEAIEATASRQLGRPLAPRNKAQ